MIGLLQKHTVDLYKLDKKEYVKQVVPAQSLITVNRFDLFAKLAYIKYRDTDPDLALKIYTDHIKVFNPDWKEPGRTDKNSLEDFVQTFDKLIDSFKEHEFDDQRSLIPVSEDGTILDGSHRIAALAFYDKKVTVLCFKDVVPVCTFDYAYFLNRGLNPLLADRIAWEAVSFTNNLHVACLWPKMGKLSRRKYALEYLTRNFDLFYVKNMRMSLGNMGKFIYETYKEQDWVGNADNNYQGAINKALYCYDTNGMVQFVVFQANSLEKVLNAKEAIREYYRLDKHALHITDSHQETQDILHLVLTSKVQEFTSSASRWKEKFHAYRILIKNVYWINIKVAIAKLLKRVGVHKP